MNNQSEPNGKFLQLYENLKRQINAIARTDSQEMELIQACARSKRVQQRRSEIVYMRDVRNLLAHPRAAVVVTQELVNDIECLIQLLTTVRIASDVGVALSKLYIATEDMKLAEVTQIMVEKHYSHIPILDRHGRVMGVFNEAAIFDYLLSQKIILLDDEIIIGDIMEHCRLDAGHTEEFRFIRPGTTEDEMLNYLTNVQGPSTRVGALFVTPSGKVSEPLSRMITIWDVLITANVSTQARTSR